MNQIEILIRIIIFPGFIFIFLLSLFLHWVDRKLIARFQGRAGPPWYQPAADLIKLLAKEDILPSGTNLWLAALLPLVSFACVLTAGIYLPAGFQINPSFEGDLIVLLFLLSIPSLLYFLAGLATQGVYSILGGNRSLLQYFSYEVLFLVAICGTAVASSSWSITDIREAQAISGSYIFPQFAGFLLSISGLIGKLKRDPYDIPKAKSEVIAGPLTEYSGKKLGLWYLTIQIQTMVGLSFLIYCYFGNFFQLGTLGGFLIFLLLLIILQAMLSAISAIYTRLRIDQLIHLNWHILIPLSLIHITLILLL